MWKGIEERIMLVQHYLRQGLVRRLDTNMNYTEWTKLVMFIGYLTNYLHSPPQFLMTILYLFIFTAYTIS